ncbi:hypothetical protein [Neisseria lactamica]|uniref:hypothetical protein n=1 Tax=Neisseria lactamica TaxID=486 RepID=UPI0002F8EB62|nr:hypothetical protein [Neisseria lactamica]
MPSEPSDGIFDALAVYRRGAGAVKYPNRHSHRQESGFVHAETYAPSFPRRRESSPFGFSHFQKLP